MSDESDETQPTLTLFEQAEELVRQLAAQNERLRARLDGAASARPDAAAEPSASSLRARIEALEAENRDLQGTLRAIQAENRQFAERYLEVEDENNKLANLYVASFQLHSTLDWSEVINVILEIVINLIGADVFCVYLLGEESRVLEPVAAEGLPLGSFSRCELGVGVVGESVASGKVYSREPEPATELGDLGDPVVSIPLRVHDHAVGAIALHGIAEQKDGFSTLDEELFSLLAGHAATAIFASRLYAQSKRKLSTIQSLIDLLSE